ncbi:acyl-CoA synthetase [Mongoliibacter ruber]|uniref:Malonyl-CoA/methylmalonyl-CoA synthetase n=1 Tax=Mongoliibacter ruber TaxID=1750599 RepID=A0A2T0WQU0_9BACT|nr:acyl-CoA synthetase [Mongoliibacter ruber]PRY89047.1 malonyl-CoA/methylmalonyl-CoA synthetase [Mongoliibacter ruber]
MLTLIQNALKFPQKTAVIDNNGVFTYKDLLDRSQEVASCLLGNANDLNQARIAFMVPPSMEYLSVQWGIWRAGGIAVPLCTTYPFPSLQYVIEDTKADILVVAPEFEKILAPYKEDQSIRFISTQDFRSLGNRELPEISTDRGAMILYTSGTTNLPKGVLTTHENIEAQISTLVEAWKWSQDDYTLSILPLHHVHGIINVNSCALWSGAVVEFLSHFDAAKVFEIFKKGHVNVFMAVPTIYFKLIAHYETLSESERSEISNCLKKFRLMVSGSAALPVSVMEKWHSISDHYLLERYGMTEIGMAISNPYTGERRAGHIGQALPGVEIRICNESDEIQSLDQPGEIQVKGPNVFKAYWGKPEATQKAFTSDGWFRTGDIAIMDVGYFKILGRDSVDIIKSGGYKISALEIEEILRTYPGVKDCGVIGIPDEEWGEIVAAAIVPTSDLHSEALNLWMRERLPAYKTPRKYLIVQDLPRNAMGKVTKNDLKKLF